MRQAGVVAATGIVALNSMINRLADDHTHARMIAEGTIAMMNRKPYLSLIISLLQPSIHAKVKRFLSI